MSTVAAAAGRYVESGVLQQLGRSIRLLDDARATVGTSGGALDGALLKGADAVLHTAQAQKRLKPHLKRLGQTAEGARVVQAYHQAASDNVRLVKVLQRVSDQQQHLRGYPFSITPSSVGTLRGLFHDAADGAQQLRAAIHAS